ncbi:hypothetical protein LXA43DRAFT_1091102 [Ganoderma leucocontextum]|nr:hypothetical protein LXA43DRAFT_1091102 [Ganoderma leucocontextum]
MSSPFLAGTGPLGTSPPTHCVGGVHSPTLLGFFSLSSLRRVRYHGDRTSHRMADPPPPPPCTLGVSRPVDGKPTWWLSTFAARRTQAPTLAANHFTVPAKRWTSQRPSGTVPCRGRATRIVRGGRVALQG